MSAGVPIEEVTAKDHMQVRAKLVKRLGGANQALVWSRVYYRADSESRSAAEVDGVMWWPASYELIADQTGLTPKQARAAVADLIEGGFLERRAHAGKIYAYRPIVHLPHRADSSDVASAQEGRPIGPTGQIHLPPGADVPLIDIRDLETGDERGKKLSETRLPKAWSPTAEHYARARERGVDIAAEVEAFRLHAETHDRHAARWNAAFTTWLNKARPSATSGSARTAENAWMYDR